MPIDPPHAGPAAALLRDFSLEMTGKDVPALEEAAAVVPPGTRINVTFLGNEDLGMRVASARAVREHGFVHILSAVRARGRAAGVGFTRSRRQCCRSQ